MTKMLKILALVGSLWAVPALAADNALVVTPGSGLTMRSIDIGAGVQAVGHALVDASGGQLGVAGAGLYIRGASGAMASGSFAAGSMVDLLTVIGTKAAGTAASNSILFGCVYNTSLPTLTNGQQAATQCDSSGRPLVTVANTNANGQATMANSSPVTIASNQSALTVVGGAADPCQTTANSTVRGNITSATTTRIITPSASNKTYICSVDLLAFAANNVAVVEGTGGTCGSGTAGVIGGTTTGNGISFPAQGGLVKGGAGFFVWNTAGTNVDFCLITSTTGPLAYFVKYVQAP